MARTSVRVQLPDVTFAGEDIKQAKVVEEFSPLSITIPIGTLDLVLYSDDVSFSIINPTGDYASLVNRQPMTVYEEIDGVDHYIGQFFLDDWANKTETLKQFKCIDIVGIMDKYEYYGGIWTNTPAGDIIADIMAKANVEYDIDPDIAATTLSGWIPICSYREALQQVLFALNAYFLVPRMQVPVIGKFANVVTVTSGPRIGHPNYIAGATRTRHVMFRPTQTIVFESGNAVTRGLRSGVFSTGQTRVWQQRWRVSQWEGIKPVVDVPDSLQGARKLNLRPQVTGIELTAHDLVESDGELELLNASLDAGDYEVRFNQPMHALAFTGSIGCSVVESGPNYAIVRATGTATHVLVGKVYLDNKTIFTRSMEGITSEKENILKITEASMVTATNGADVCDRVFDYYQQRYVQNVKFYSLPVEIGGIVNMQTLYRNNLYGVIEKMTSNLTGGNTANAEVVGIITGYIWPGYSGKEFGGTETG